ncbi:chemotaxis protein CheX [Ureibacillus massiliensis 4400831 = CIP 108448 = CCUG 49529]|uniref:Chemotaxis protein CheX n=2 Tax=cellular organisms TaxID=131567 RepID=A0A0A3J465_9BACL|nr:chemotaxis protein CheX [Ureibacillus massiliensis]KGR90505.1 chemotaxis protein CheX [Ureibacillus massiliensis 4400831 = CIP 108448 = CCUG 49529]
MENSNNIQLILDGTIHAIKTIVPMDVNIQPYTLMNEPYVQQEIGVLIGLIGDFKGRIIIDSSLSTFSEIGSNMFGMPLEGIMLESFTGEFGNMIAGNLCTYIESKSVNIDITPPTVMVGNTKLYGFETAYRLPITIDGIGSITILFTLDEE